MKEKITNTKESYKIGQTHIFRRHAFIPQDPGVISAVAQIGDSILLGTLVSYDDSRPFFDVHYIDKFAADNKHPSGFIKIETRKPHKNRIIMSRLIDRSLRPLVDGFNFQLIVRLLNNGDSETNNAEAAIALAGDLIWQAGYVSHPIYPYVSKSSGNTLQISYSKDGISMIEASLDFKQREEILEDMRRGHQLSQEFFKEIFPAKKSENMRAFDDLRSDFLKKALEGCKDLYFGDLHMGKSFLKDLIEDSSDPRASKLARQVLSLFYKTYGRYDGRDRLEIRELEISTFPLSKPLGSCLFARGSTKVISTLVISNEAQTVNEASSEKYVEYLNVQYDMLGHAVGSPARLTSHSRREIGHGNLIYNGLRNLYKNQSIAVYMQNDVLSCDGSSSMAGLTASSVTLYLCQLTEELVTGITVGRISKGEDFMVDISGLEDWLGLMDLKVGGNRRGLTVLQGDFKEYLPQVEEIARSLELAQSALEEKLTFLNRELIGIERRKSELPLSQDTKTSFFESMKIEEKDIKYMIGYKGFNFKRIIEETKVRIKLDEESLTLKVFGNVKRDLDRAIESLSSLLKLPQKDEIYEAEVLQRFGRNLLVQPYKARSGFVEVEDGMDFKLSDKIKVQMLKGNEDKIFYTVVI